MRNVHGSRTRQTNAERRIRPGRRGGDPGLDQSIWKEVRIDIDPRNAPDLVGSISDIRGVVEDHFSTRSGPPTASNIFTTTKCSPLCANSGEFSAMTASPSSVARTWTQ